VAVSPTFRAFIGACVLWPACAPAPWPDPPPVERAAFIAAHAAWRSKVQQTIRDNYVALAGLWPLSDERTPFGTDSSLPIVLPGPGPRAVVGTFVRHSHSVQLEPRGSRLLLSDTHRPLIATVVLRADDDSQPSYIHFGSFRLWIHSEDGREYVRAMDDASPRLRGFTLAPEYVPDPSWRVTARFDAYGRPKAFRIADVTGADQSLTVPGELVFRLAGREFRLQAFVEPSSSKWLWLMFKDSTNLRETYGAGRYLWVPAPDATGWTTIDFNQAISPPCAYTAYATCPLPPEENRLMIRIAAGEKRAH
jgi:uncharacterized protein (DUF1684 family)